MVEINTSNKTYSRENKNKKIEKKRHLTFHIKRNYGKSGLMKVLYHQTVGREASGSAGLHRIHFSTSVSRVDGRELKQRRRRRQRQRRKTIGLMSKNNRSARAFYILIYSLPSSAKQQREMTTFKVLWRT